MPGVPARAECLAGSSCSKDCKLEATRGDCLPLAELGHKVWNVVDRHSCMMAARELLTCRQDQLEMPAPGGRVLTGPVALDLSRVQYILDPASYTGCRFGDRLPDRLQDGEHVRGCNFIDPLGTQGFGALPEGRRRDCQHDELLRIVVA